MMVGVGTGADHRATGAAVAFAPAPLGPFQPHRLHGVDRTWTETNCYLDLWIEVLHSLDLDVVAAGACALSADFEGDQWRFLKYPPEDLRALYGIDVAEMAIWRPLIEHVLDQLSRGRLLTVEVDAFWLPDTAGVSYREVHTKTTIVPHSLEPDDATLGYFHNAGYFQLSGEDFDGMFRLGAHEDAAALVPYVELVRFDDLRRDPADVVARAVALAHEHLERRPPDNPVGRLGRAIVADVAWLRSVELETFHRYAFAMVRQCGVTAELAADFVAWLTEHDVAQLAGAAANFRAVATGAKTIQFQLARLVRGRTVDIETPLERLADLWSEAMAEVVAWHES
jgi:hypothetical protein